jgi:hypothetical protein
MQKTEKKTIWFGSFWQTVNKKCLISETYTLDNQLNCCEVRNMDDDDDDRYGKTSPSPLFLLSSPLSSLLLLLFNVILAY